MMTFWIIAAVVSYCYAVGITLWFLREQDDDMSWLLALSISVFWPFALAGGICAFIYVFFRESPHMVRRWKRKLVRRFLWDKERKEAWNAGYDSVAKWKEAIAKGTLRP